jgi:hypothetical protein
LATSERTRSVAPAVRRSRLVVLCAAVLTGGALLLVPTPQREGSGPPAVTAVWPAAQRAVIPADLDDGAAFTPATFADARTAIGTAPTPDGKALRLLVRRGDGTVRPLRSLPMSANPSYPSVTVAGGLLVWAESAAGGRLALWTAGLDGRDAPRRLIADAGPARFYQSQYDLVVADGRVHWVADGRNNDTEIRSVALTGGPVTVSVEPGRWQLSAWPWLINGVAAAGGSTMLRNLAARQDVGVASARRTVTKCSPAWCRSVSFGRDGYPRIVLMRPDGSARHEVATGEVETQIADVAVLDRFEIYGKIGPNGTLTGNAEILLYEISTRRTVAIAPDASSVDYRNGVLWWSTGSQESYVRHALDLRTI